jgi:hypothetical protein
VTLGEVLARVEEFSEEETVFSRRPWRFDEDAILVRMDEEGRIPSSTTAAGWDYFLEVTVAKEVLEVFEGAPPTPGERRNLLLFYGENDAFPDWVYER